MKNCLPLVGFEPTLASMRCRPSTSECGQESEPHLIQSSTSLTSTASKAEEQIFNWLKSLHHRKQRILYERLEHCRFNRSATNLISKISKKQ
ncbi:hypothetical protein NQ317_002760 [Molorchus minor]|uniref:Uncharacterized protein n=1 Tax=Molorchus minor TaxID=1323400 RepID=A0ABQ9J658_9CUCU|nr:hypothetical protein NQ317_002760 [Molorchus minor]